VITTSHGTLDRPGASTGRPTGVFASELTQAYYAFLDAGMQVDVASIEGGVVPIDPDSLRWFVATPSDRRMLADPALQGKLRASPAVTALDFAAYDLVYLAGGWGAAYDFAPSASLGEGVTRAWAAGRVVGSVCHGALGLLQAREAGGAPLVRRRAVTAVTDLQLVQLGIAFTPSHPERELRAAGAHFESRSAWREVFAQHTVVDGRLVTGQNQNASLEVAHAMLRLAGAQDRP
jgi:putative intracellular protease/amidase